MNRVVLVQSSTSDIGLFSSRAMQKRLRGSDVRVRGLCQEKPQRTIGRTQPIPLPQVALGMNTTTTANTGSEEDDEDRKRPARMPKGEHDGTSDGESASSAEQLAPKVAPSSPSKTVPAVSVRTKGKVTRKGAGGARKEKGMPSRPLSAYNMYFREARLQLMSESPRFQGQERSNNPGLFAELGKAIAERWKSISEEDLTKYKNLAALDMERYSREMSEYRLNRAKFRLREESAAAAASSASASASEEALVLRDQRGREGEAPTSFSFVTSDSVRSDERRPPPPPVLPAFADTSLLRTNALLQCLQRTSDLVAPASSYQPMYELTRPPSSDRHRLSPPRHASAQSEVSSSLQSPVAQRQELDGMAVARALRIRQLEDLIARQNEQRRLPRESSFDWQLAMDALDRDRLARAGVYPGAASALAAASLPGSPAPPYGTYDSALASAWGGHQAREPLRLPGAPNSDIFPSFFGLASTQRQEAPLRSSDFDDPATTGALLGQLLAQQSQQVQNDQLLQLLRQQQQQPQPQLSQQQRQLLYRPPPQSAIDPAARLMLLQQLMDQRSPDRRNLTRRGDGSNDPGRESM
jgi:HMG (high mobility group) box